LPNLCGSESIGFDFCGRLPCSATKYDANVRRNIRIDVLDTDLVVGRHGLVLVVGRGGLESSVTWLSQALVVFIRTSRVGLGNEATDDSSESLSVTSITSISSELESEPWDLPVWRPALRVGDTSQCFRVDGLESSIPEYLERCGDGEPDSKSRPAGLPGASVVSVETGLGRPA
jgi:hypothetical protein